MNYNFTLKAFKTLFEKMTMQPQKRPKHTYEDGASYDGEWVEAKRHGKGKFQWKDKTSYDGIWDQDMKHGQGTLVYDDGSKYTGVFVKD